MIKHTLLAAAFVSCFIFLQQAKAEAFSAPGVPTVLDQQGKSILMPVDAEWTDLAGATQKPWEGCGGKTNSTAKTLEWKVSAPTEGDYEVEMFEGGILEIGVAGGSNTLFDAMTRNNWLHRTVGVTHLKKGTTSFKIMFPQGLPFKDCLTCVTLLPMAAKADFQSRVVALRAKTDVSWALGNKYGIFLQYGGWGFPVHGLKSLGKKW